MLKDLQTNQQNVHPRKHKKEVIAEEPLVQIPPGEYQAVCKKAVYKFCQGGDKRLFIEFVIIEGKFAGVQLFMVCPTPSGKLRIRHKLYNQWAIVLGRKPHKGERFNRKIFEKKMYKVSVRNTRKKFSGTGRIMPEYLQYSVVDEIIEVVAGLPND